MKKQTKGVKNLLGDPKKGLVKLAIPIMASNIIQTIYSVADAIWVSGISSKALSAVGFYFPFFFIAIAIGMGLGIGGGSSISRKIGANDEKGAGQVAIHTMLLTIFIAALFSLGLYFSIGKIYNLLKVGNAMPESMAYAKIMIIGTFFLFFSMVSSSLLRAEGDTKRAMIALAFGSVLNIILDPIFIYSLDLGVAGAAWASIISIGASSLFMFDWLFLKKNTYIQIHIKSFIFSISILKDILKVGLPASFQFTAMAVSMFIMNGIITRIAGPDGVAVYSTGWRILSLGTMPVFGISGALVSVAGAAYGGKQYEKLSIAYNHAIKIGIIIEFFAAIIAIIFTPLIVMAFTFSEGTKHISDDLILFLRITAISYPAVAVGPSSSSLFQGVGKGLTALVVTIFRTIILAVPLALLFAYTFDLKLAGIWWGISVANAISAIISFSWAKMYIRGLKA